MNMSGYRADVCYARGSMWDSRTRPIVEISEIHGCWGHMAEVSCWGQKRVFRVLRATVRGSYMPTGCPGETRHGGVRGRTGNVRLTAYVYGLARETSCTGGTRAALKSRVDTTAFMESPDEGRWFNISRDLARSRLNLSRADLVSRYLARSRPFRACSLRELPVTFR